MWDWRRTVRRAAWGWRNAPGFRREHGLADLGLVVGVARRSLAATAGRSSDRSAHHRADKGREVGARTESIHAAADLTFAADPSSYSQTTSPADGSTAPMAKERSELTMAWTIACYCGNVYTAPPDRCEICGSALESSASNGADAYNYRQPADLRDVDVEAAPTPARGQGTAVG